MGECEERNLKVQGSALTRVSYLKRVIVQVVKSAQISDNLAGFMLYKKKIIPSNILGYSFSCSIIGLNITPQNDKMGKLKSLVKKFPNFN